MITCYHKDIIFEDPAFGTLKGELAKSMWLMLLNRSQGDLKIEYSDVKVAGATGTARWKATYFYGKAKRKVLNEVQAEFQFKDGKIIKHTDRFDLWTWTRQALGISGYLLGWSSFMKRKIQKSTNKMLDDFMSNSAS